MSRKPTSYWLVTLAVGAFALRVAYCAATVGLGHSSEIRYTEYAVAAERLLQQGTLVSPLLTDDKAHPPSAMTAPGYVGLTAVLYALLGVKSFLATLAAQLINAVAGAITVVLVFDVACRLGDRRAAWRRKAGWVAAILVALNPLLLRFTTFIWDTNLFTLGVVLSVWICVCFSQKDVGWRGWFGFGFFLGALALLNPALTVAYPILILWPASRSTAERLAAGWRLRPIASRAGLALLGWLIAITPWTVRNYVHFGRLIYVRNGFMHELWLGACPEAQTDGGAIFSRWYALDNEGVRGELADLGEQRFIDEYGRRAKAAIAEDPVRFIRLVGMRALDYWAGTVYSHVPEGASGWPSDPIRAAVLLFLLAEGLTIVAACAWLRRGVSAEVVWLLVIVVSFSFVYCLTHVELRYRAATEPIIAIIVAVLLSRARFRSAQGRSAVRPPEGRAQPMA